jgi:N-acetylneuraminate synthase
MKYITQRDRELFENFFVLELANNHWGRLNRGIKIIREHGAIVRYNNVKAAIKLQFRDVDEFIHPEFKGNTEHRYIKKVLVVWRFRSLNMISKER